MHRHGAANAAVAAGDDRHLAGQLAGSTVIIGEINRLGMHGVFDTRLPLLVLSGQCLVVHPSCSFSGKRSDGLQTRAGRHRVCLVAVLEAEIGGLHITFGRAAIEALALEFVSQHTALLGLFHQGIGDLDLAALAWLGLLDQGEDVGREDVATDDRQVGRRIFWVGFLHHAVDAKDVITQRLASDHAIARNFLHWHFLNGDDGAAELFVELDHLGQYAVAIEIQAQVIGQHHGESLVADQRAPGEDGVAKPLHCDLAGVGKGALVDQGGMPR